jgi:hypothetical protein
MMKKLLGMIFGNGDSGQTGNNLPDFGTAYQSWKGPWLVYNGSQYPLDIPGVTASQAAMVEIDVRPGTRKQSVRGGSISGCNMSTVGTRAYINNISLDDYVASFPRSSRG